MAAPKGPQRPVRYWRDNGDGSISIYEAGMIGGMSIEYGKTIQEVRQLYSNFRLLKLREASVASESSLY
jgi:hypothetical protein